MSNYTVITDWDGKDALADSNPAKVISGDEFQDEFDAIATAVSTKADINGSASETFSALSLSLGGTPITATAAELNTLDGVTSTATELNLLDGITAIADEDDMTSDSDTSLATQQSIKAYVDAAVAAASMTWTYITRNTLYSTTGNTGSGTYQTLTIPATIPSDASSIIVTFETRAISATTNFKVKSSSVSERIINESYSPQTYDDTSSSWNTVTLPYTSTIQVQYNSDSSNSLNVGKVHIDGYIT